MDDHMMDTQKPVELSKGDKLLVSFFQVMNPKMAGQLEERLIVLSEENKQLKEKIEQITKYEMTEETA